MVLTDKIINAKITNTFLGREDHSIPTFGISIETSEGWCTTIGYYSLAGYDKQKKEYSWCNFEILFNILEVVGVDSWEELKGKYIRIKVAEKWNDPIVEIGNLMADNWVNLKEWFMEENNK